MSDVIEKARREIEARLAELRPVIDEIRRLEDALAALTGESSAPAKRGPGRPPKSATSTRRSSGKRARPGENKRKILTAIRENPGITAAQVAEKTGLPKPSVASSISKMKRDGEVESAGGSGLRIGSAPCADGNTPIGNGNDNRPVPVGPQHAGYRTQRGKRVRRGMAVAVAGARRDHGNPGPCALHQARQTGIATAVMGHLHDVQLWKP
jgi:hypothetical protein